MIDADSRTFAAEMSLLAEVFGEQLSPTRIRAYFEALEDFDLAEVRRACRGAIRTCRFFPRPAELIEAMRERRRALRVEAQQALPEPKELTDEERREIDQARAEFMAVVSRDVARLFTPGGFPEVGPEALAAHERHKREAIERFFPRPLPSGQKEGGS